MRNIILLRLQARILGSEPKELRRVVALQLLSIHNYKVHKAREYWEDTQILMKRKEANDLSDL